MRKKTRKVFALFKSISCETDLWVTLGDVAVKTQNLEGKSEFNWKLIQKKKKDVVSVG